MPYIMNKQTGSEEFIPEDQLDSYQGSGMMEENISGTEGGMDQDLINQLQTNTALQVIKQGGKLSDIKSAFEMLKASEPTEKEMTQDSLDRRLTTLEGLWFPYEDSLAMPKAGNWIERKTHKLKKTYEASSEYELFSRYARTLGATLAKAAGDTGNIAWAEQAAQLQALADADLTKEEAEKAFSNIREGLGIPKPRANYYETIRQTGVTKPETTKQKSKSTPLEGLSMLQRLFGTQEETLPINLPLSGAGGEIGSVAGSFLPLPPGLRTLLGGSVGQTYENIGREGLPLTPQAQQQQAQQMGIQGNPKNPLTFLNPMNQARMDYNLAKPILPYVAADVLFNLGGLTGGLKQTLAKKLSGKGVNIPAKEIIEPQTKNITQRLGYGKDALKKISELTEKYANKPLELVDALSRKTFLGKLARTTGGGVKSTSTAALADLERNLVRKAIHDRSKLIAGLDAIDSLIIRTGKIGKWIGKVGTTGAVGAGAAYGISKALGGRD